MMSGIKGENTKPELLIRRGLHARGFRFRIHPKNITGKPDLVLPRYHAAIFVNGCFWHWHDCHLFKLPRTRPEFWKEKLNSNRKRDDRVRSSLLDEGWRVLTIWECALKGRSRLDAVDVVERAASWIRGETLQSEIRGLG